MTHSQFPVFNPIHYQEISSQLEFLLKQNRQQIKELLDQRHDYTWDNLMVPLEEIEDKLSHFWSPISHLSSVKDCPELRAAYNLCIPLLSQYSSELGQNEQLYKAILS